MSRYLLILSIVVISFFLSFDLHNDLLEKIAAKLEKYYLEFPEEKAFIQTDKPFYVAGETMWYKAYLVEAVSNIPDSVSIPLYVELIDPAKDQLVNRHVLKLDGGISHGDFELPQNLTTGTYVLRAYTNWMRNFNPDLYFSKLIKILAINHKEQNVTGNEEDIDIQFFPEGGDLVEGLESRVAFKAIDAAGNGVDLIGKLVSSHGDTISRFKSDHIGMGTFKFKPMPDISYKAIILFRKYTKSFDLPLAKKQGMTMTVDNISSRSQIRLSVNNNISTSGMLIVGQSRGVIFYASKVDAGIPTAFIPIAKDKFPAGIAQFTIFDESLKPHCERIVYIPDTKPLQIHIASDKSEYTSREKTTIDLEVKDIDGKPIQGSFLISVLDETQINDFSGIETIQSYLLLNSDIKGHVDNPTYYFDKTNKYAAMHLDILLMSQGWRRFTWNDIFQDQLPAPKHLIEKGLIVAGHVLKPNGRPFEKPQNITLMIGRDTNQQFLMSTTNDDGSFLFYGLDFKDTVPILAQLLKTESNQKSSITLQIQSFADQKINQTLISYPNRITDNFSQYILNAKQAIDYENQLKLNDAIWLSEISVQAKKKQKAPDGPRVLYSRPDDVVKAEVSPSALTVFDLIRGRVSGVTISGDRSDPKVTIRGGSSISLSSEPLYLIDGNPVNKQTVLSLNINAVDRVEVIKSLAGGVMYGDQARGGIVSVFMKSAADIPETLADLESKGNINAIFQGYYTQKQFYSPKYKSGEIHSSIPDMRSTIYWNPDVKTNVLGKASIEYYNSDAQSNIRVYAEGLSAGGRIGVNQLNYSVKK